MILALADRWHCRPSEVLAEPAESLKMIEIVALGTPATQDGDGGVDDGW